MKSLNCIKVFAALSIGLFASITFAGEVEVAGKLGPLFDSVILENGLSKTNLEELSKPGRTQIEVQIDGEPEVFQLVATKESGIHITAFKNEFKEHKSLPVVNCVSAELQKKYIYKNLFGSEVVYKLTFSSDAIKRLCELPQQALPLEAILAQDLIQQIIPVEPILPPVLIPEVTQPVLPVQFVQDDEESTSDCSLLEDSDDQFFDCDGNDDSSECGSFEGSGCPKTLKGTSVRLQLLDQTFGDMANMMQQALVVASQGDHIWSAVANGTRGAINLYEAATNFDVLSAFVGVADLATAVVSGERARRAICGSSKATQELFNNLDVKLDMIGGISDEMDDLLNQVSTSLSQINASLDQYADHQQALSQRLLKASGDEAAQIREALDILKAAQADNLQASVRLDTILRAVKEIGATWSEVKYQLDVLAQTATEPLNSKEESRAQILQKMTTIESQAKQIKKSIESLEEPMKLVNEFIAEIGLLNVRVGGHFTDAISHLVKVSEEKAKLETEFCRLAQENKDLKDARCLLSKTESGVSEIQCLNAKLKQVTSSAEKDVEELKVAVDQKYDLAHLLVGAGVAVATATLLAPGIIPTAGLALLATHGAKIVEWNRSGRNTDAPQFQTRMGRWAYCCGVSEGTIKAVGTKVLRIDYSAVNASAASSTQPDSLDTSSNKK